jgi:hypothetical protein
MKKIAFLTLPAVALALAGTAVASPDRHAAGFQLKGKVLAVAQVDAGEPGQTLGDQQVITMDVFSGAKRVGESHVTCTVIRLDATTHAFTAQCQNVTSLPGGVIVSEGLVTSAQEETSPFVQAVTGGTGVYRRAHGELTVDEAGPQPATLTFDIE